SIPSWKDSIPDWDGWHWGHHHRLDIESPNSSVSVSLYPNPITTSANLHIENAADGSLEFRLFDYTGRLITLKQNLSSGDYTLSRSDLTGGIYFYEIYSASVKVGSGKIVVQ